MGTASIHAGCRLYAFYPAGDGGFEVIQSGLYSHPRSYAVDHYYWDSNLWGHNLRGSLAFI